MAEAIYDPESAAILFWLAPYITKLPSGFDVHLDTEEPPRSNPESFWKFEDAVVYAIEVELQAQKHTKRPWIKVGNHVLAPADVAAAYRQIKGGN